MNLLTKEEKECVLRVMNEKPGLLHAFGAYSAYLVPSLVMALYGLATEELPAVIVGYGALFAMVIFYIVLQSGIAEHFVQLLKNMMLK